MSQGKILEFLVFFILLPFSLPGQSLQVLHPAGGEVFIIGENARVEWTSQELSGTVRIDLMRSGWQVGEIESGRPIDERSVSWVPWASLPDADDYYIRLTANSNYSIEAFSASFTIKQPDVAFEIIYPAGGETLFIGESALVLWSSRGLTGSVRVDLLRGDIVVGEIASERAVSAGHLSWTPWQGLADGHDYAIRLISSADPAVKAFSGQFSITIPILPALRVIRPVGGETFVFGDTTTIEWTSQGLDGTIRINLMKDNLVHTMIAAEQPVEEGRSTWVVGDTLPEASDYSIHIVSNILKSVDAVSKGPFTIKAPDRPTLLVTYPSGGETFTIGDSTIVEWTSEHLNGTVRIFLMKGDVVHTMIAAERPVEEGRYAWVVGDTLPEASDYSILLVSRMTPQIQARSAGSFAIKALTVPVELTRFEAALGENGVVHLYWETASETNHIGFQVQRRLTGQSEFQTVKYIAGGNTTIAGRKYEITDRPGQMGYVHYRLRQFDINGTLTQSATLTVSIPAPAEFKLTTNYPNPVRVTSTFGAVTSFDFALPGETEVVGKIYDITGRFIETVVAGKYHAGWHSFVWKVAPTAASGIYFLRLEANGRGLVRKIYLVK